MRLPLLYMLLCEEIIRRHFESLLELFYCSSVLLDSREALAVILCILMEEA